MTETNERRKDYFNIQLQLSEISNDMHHIKKTLEESREEKKEIYREMRERDLRINNLDGRFSLCQATHSVAENTKDKSTNNTRANIAIIISGFSAVIIVLRDFAAKLFSIK